MPGDYPGFGGRVERLVGDSEPWWPAPVRPPAGAPNIVVVLLDDMGYSDVGPFGSEIPTPNLDRLADRGVRLANYHTTPLCSPSRAAIQTGLNPHKAGYASVANFDPGFPGWTMEISPDVRTLPEVLRDNGYATFAVGKWHLTRDAVMHDAAPRHSWPVQRGFDRFYGMLEGLTNLHHPHRLVLDNSPVEIDEYPLGYYFTDDITDRAISWLQALRAHDAAKPFFLYVAHGAVHGPLQAKPDDIDRYRGHYDRGWDDVRAERFRRQLEIGLFPPGTALPARNAERGHEVGRWDDLPAEERALFARYMEVYAAMVDNVDQNLGRLLDVLERTGDLDNTVVVFTSDNGGTEEGGERGSRSYFKQFGGLGTPQHWQLDVPRDPSLIGGPRALVHYPRGWGMASNTPFRLYKTHTHAGGVRVPFVVSWPAWLHARGIRHQYQYVTDLLPTLLDLAGLIDPGQRDGRSFAPVLHEAAVASTHLEQYSECFGNRSFYRDGWKLVTLHAFGTPYDDGEWELFDLANDPTETRNLATERPDKVRELSRAWERAAWDNAVFPLNDGTGLLLLLRRPDEQTLTQPVTILPGTPTLERYRSQKLVALRSFEFEVDLEHGRGDAGVLVAHGDQGGGYALFVGDDGHLTLAYNQYGEVVEADGGTLPPGRHVLTVATTAGPGLTWDWTLAVSGEIVARLDETEMLLGLAPLQGIDVGLDRRSPVVWRYHERHGAFRYTGALHRVTYRPGPPAPYNPEVLAAALRAAGRAAQ
jgi:arylsulfatase